MDPLDVKIFRKLRSGGRSEFDPFPTGVNSLRQVASELDVDKDTVRKRIAIMQKRGMFLGWSAMINPNSLSLKAQRVWLGFHNKESKNRVTEELTKIRNVRTITIYFGDTLSFVFAHREGSQDPQRYVVELAKQAGEAGTFAKLRECTISFPECSRKLSANDRKLYEAVRNRVGKPRADISQEAGLSTRTVKRRFGELAEGSAILLLSALDPRKIDGVALELFVKSSSKKALGRLMSRITTKYDDFLLTIEEFEETSASFYFVVENIYGASDCFDYVRSQSESELVEPQLIQETLRVRERSRL
jgi:DNA-binding Lrp family transcriptional regulator